MKARYLIYILLSVVLIAECSKESGTLAYETTEIGSITGSIFKGDGGNTYDIVEDAAGVKDMERAYVTFDVLSKTADKRYDIAVKKYQKALVKDPIYLTQAPDTLGNDAIYLYTAWLSGGYLNMRVVMNFKLNSTVSHWVNLVYDDTAEMDTLRFHLTHNGHGEGNILTATDTTGYRNGAAMMSIPIVQLMPSSMNEIPIKVTSTWYERDTSGVYTGDLKTYTRTGTLYR